MIRKTSERWRVNHEHRSVNFSEHRRKETNKQTKQNKTVLQYKVSHLHRFHKAVKYPSLCFEAALLLSAGSGEEKEDGGAG